MREMAAPLVRRVVAVSAASIGWCALSCRADTTAPRGHITHLVHVRALRSRRGDGSCCRAAARYAVVGSLVVNSTVDLVSQLHEKP